MSEVGSLKWIEAGLLLAAGAAFGWWQLRDVKRAQAESRRRKSQEPLRPQPHQQPHAEDEPRTRKEDGP